MVDITQAQGRIEQFLSEYLDEAGADGYVLGVSGGLDSAVTLHLATAAVGPEQVHGLVLPARPSRSDNVDDARELCDELGVEHHEIDIAPVVEAFRSRAPGAMETGVIGNLRVRTRTVFQYAVANQEDRLVLGASNRTELLLGYFTKYGDGAADVKPLADLYKTEVRQLAGDIGLPTKFVEKQPTAGMWEGQTDEGELGASYDTIDRILEHVVDRDASVDIVVEETGIDRETVERVVAMHEDSAHKREPVPTPGLR